MSVPKDIDNYASLIALDENQLRENNVAEEVITRVIRFRALYTYWCKFSSKSPREIVEFDIMMFKVGESQAYDDVHCLKVIMGNLQETSKKFWRWRINQMLEEDRKAAKRDGDHRAVASIEKNFIKNNLTDKEDTPDMAFDKIVPAEIQATDDPSAIGIKPLPNLRARIKKLNKKYYADAEFVEFVEVPAAADNNE
ncbi:MAG: hypothetical protein J6M36_09825 [Prevotella sp.]|jgi:hypothetical protein|nr:hypothetical protein [Prevotella sp.]